MSAHLILSLVSLIVLGDGWSTIADGKVANQDILFWAKFLGAHLVFIGCIWYQANHTREWWRNRKILRPGSAPRAAATIDDEIAAAPTPRDASEHLAPTNGDALEGGNVRVSSSEWITDSEDLSLTKEIRLHDGARSVGYQFRYSIKPPLGLASAALGPDAPLGALITHHLGMVISPPLPFSEGYLAYKLTSQEIAESESGTVSVSEAADGSTVLWWEDQELVWKFGSFLSRCDNAEFQAFGESGSIFHIPILRNEHFEASLAHIKSKAKSIGQGA
ncbi:hypothetical protein [Spongiibacter marinus]|uniref:hypothetical protein n=1 Tax=Spongiibacter marinus TaxID=354246 RepID=UPI00195FBC4A|nr:hypothetical protein [Spongiibacter marinus]MBM7424670.1 hypothetical protein [Spongiibacter marinus]